MFSPALLADICAEFLIPKVFDVSDPSRKGLTKQDEHNIKRNASNLRQASNMGLSKLLSSRFSCISFYSTENLLLGAAPVVVAVVVELHGGRLEFRSCDEE